MISCLDSDHIPKISHYVDANTSKSEEIQNLTLLVSGISDKGCLTHKPPQKE